MSWEGWAVLVSLAGVLGSYLGLYLTWRHSTRSREIAEEALAVEKRRERAERRAREEREAERKKAEFSVGVVDGLAPNWRDKAVAVENVGRGTARNVRVFVDGEPAGESEFLRSELAPQPGQSLSPSDPPLYFPYGMRMGSPEQVSVRVVWDDDSESDRSREVPLRV